MAYCTNCGKKIKLFTKHKILQDNEVICLNCYNNKEDALGEDDQKKREEFTIEVEEQIDKTLKIKEENENIIKDKARYSINKYLVPQKEDLIITSQVPYLYQQGKTSARELADYFGQSYRHGTFLLNACKILGWLDENGLTENGKKIIVAHNNEKIKLIKKDILNTEIFKTLKTEFGTDWYNTKMNLVPEFLEKKLNFTKITAKRRAQTIKAWAMFMIQDRESYIRNVDVETNETVDLFRNKVDVKYNESIDNKAKRSNDKKIKIDTFADGLRRNIKDYRGPLANIIKYVPDFYELFESLLKEKKFDSGLRSIINSVVAYFVLPDDVIPEDEYGAYGYIDDIYLCVYVLDTISSEKDTINKYWKKDGDAIELAKNLKNEIEKLSNDIVDKEKLKITLEYIKQNLDLYESQKPHEHKKEIEQISIKQTSRDKIIEKEVHTYDNTLYYLRESDSFLELVDRNTDLIVLTLDKNRNILQPKESDISGENKIEDHERFEKKCEIIKYVGFDEQTGKKIIEFDCEIYSLLEDGTYFRLKSNNKEYSDATYNKEYYILKPLRKDEGISVEFLEDGDLYIHKNEAERIGINEAKQLKNNIEKILHLYEKEMKLIEINNLDMSKIIIKRKCKCLSEILDIYINNENFTVFPEINEIKNRLSPILKKTFNRIIKDLIQIDPTLDKYAKIGFIGLDENKLKLLEFKYNEKINEEINEIKNRKKAMMKTNGKENKWTEFKGHYK